MLWVWQHSKNAHEEPLNYCTPHDRKQYKNITTASLKSNSCLCHRHNNNKFSIRALNDKSGCNSGWRNSFYFSLKVMAIKDKHGRHIKGSDKEVREVVDYVVFERHLTNKYGKWRVCGKLFPQLPRKQNTMQPQLSAGKDVPSVWRENFLSRIPLTFSGKREGKRPWE